MPSADGCLSNTDLVIVVDASSAYDAAAITASQRRLASALVGELSDLESGSSRAAVVGFSAATYTLTGVPMDGWWDGGCDLHRRRFSNAERWLQHQRLQQRSERR